MLHRNCPRRINAGGHDEPMDSVVEGYTFPIPEGAAVIAINRRGSATSSLSVLTVPEKSVTERLTALESSTLANSCIVAFGDSITAMSDDKGKSYIDYVADMTGAEVTVRTWSGRSEPINVAAIKCETATGVTIEARQNKYGMFETFTSNYMAYSNLDIPHMVYGLTSGDWRCQKLAAEHLSSQGVAGMVEKIVAVAKRNHIAVHDMYYSIGWNRWNFAKFFKNGDSTHPAYGLKWMAQKIAKYL